MNGDSMGSGVLVECLIVNDSPGFAVGLARYDHPCLPHNWSVVGYSFKYSSSYITFNICLYSIMPVQGYRDYFVTGYWGGFWVHV